MAQERRSVGEEGNRGGLLVIRKNKSCRYVEGSQCGMVACGVTAGMAQSKLGLFFLFGSLTSEFRCVTLWPSATLLALNGYESCYRSTFGCLLHEGIHTGSHIPRVEREKTNIQGLHNPSFAPMLAMTPKMPTAVRTIDCIPQTPERCTRRRIKTTHSKQAIIHATHFTGE